MAIDPGECYKSTVMARKKKLWFGPWTCLCHVPLNKLFNQLDSDLFLLFLGREQSDERMKNVGRRVWGKLWKWSQEYHNILKIRWILISPTCLGQPRALSPRPHYYNLTEPLFIPLCVWYLKPIKLGAHRNGCSGSACEHTHRFLIFKLQESLMVIIGNNGLTRWLGT